MYRFRSHLLWTISIVISLDLIGCMPALHAQDLIRLDTFSRDKIPVLLEPLQYPDDLPPQLVTFIQEVIDESFENHWHFQLIDPSEGERAGEIDPEYIIQLNLQPIIEDLKKDPMRGSDGRVSGTNYFIAMGIRLNLRVTDIVSGELKYSHNVDSVRPGRGFKPDRSNFMKFITGDRPAYGKEARPYDDVNTPSQEARIIQDEKSMLFQQAVERFPYTWHKALANIFPAPIHLQEILKGNERRPEVLRIDAGKNFGLIKGRPLEVYTIKIYRVHGNDMARELPLSTFIPMEVQAETSIGHLTENHRTVGRALMNGDRIFFRFK